MLATLRVPAVLIIGSLALSGCANVEGFGGNDMTTSSVAPQPRVDPACVVLTSQIDTLRREGIADKIEKAALKKYKMTPGDLVKADQLTKANAEFQTKCSTISPRPTTAQTTAPVAAAGATQVPVQPVAKAQKAQ